MSIKFRPFGTSIIVKRRPDLYPSFNQMNDACHLFEVVDAGIGRGANVGVIAGDVIATCRPGIPLDGCEDEDIRVVVLSDIIATCEVTS